MAIILVLVIVAVASCSNVPDIPEEFDREPLKKDYMIKAQGSTTHRLAAWQVLSPTKVKCDMVRPQFKKFGYCWNDTINEQAGINTDKERGWVREVVQQWEKCGGIQIVEEPTCRFGPDFIKINVGDYHPMVQPFMETSPCKILGFHMYISFYTSDPVGTGYRRTEKVHKAVLQMYALHEFGHFLGFDHEHNRLDMKSDKCTRDDVVVGPNATGATRDISKEYDLDSIMNYCRPHVHYKPWLSDIDKKAVAMAYGGGDKAECDAVTGHWKWSKGEGMDDIGVRAMEIEETMGFNACADLMEGSGCEGLKGSCKDKAMEFYCPKTCSYCK